MGYYVSIMKNDFCIKKENYETAYKAVCELNAHDELKSGGSFGGSPTPKPANSKSLANNPDKWFAWMPWNYDETCDDLIAVLEELGFDVSCDESGICNLWYDNKMGAEEHFMNALAPYVQNGSYIVWKGEDDNMWVWEFQDGMMYEEQAYITW